MRPLLLALIATLLLAAPASAARFQRNGAAIDFTVAPTDVVNLSASGHAVGSPLELTFTRNPRATALTAGPGCSLQLSIVRCGVVKGTTLRFATGDRPDVIDASRTTTPLDASVPESFDTGGGNDVIGAGPLADTVAAGAGDDRVTGGPGADSLAGSEGDDTFVGLTAGDRVDGGDGSDLLDLSGETAGVSISMDGVADDGALGADASVIGIESVRGTSGDDAIDVRDGVPGTVDCGPGADLAVVDESDVVTGCERVELPPAAPDAGGAAEETAPVAAPDAVVAPQAGRVVAAVAKPPSLVAGRLSFEFVAFPNGITKVTRLLVRDLSRGGRAELRCRGRCAFRSRAAKVRGAKANLRRLIRGRLRAGTVLEVRLTAPGTIGRVIRFTLRKGKLPKRTNLCLPPGARKPSRCAA